MRPRTALSFVPLTAALLLPAAPAAADPVPTPPVAGGVSTEDARVFADDSFWYRELPTETPVASDSDAIVADLVRQAEEHYGSPGKPNLAINTTQFTPTVYVTDASDPVVEVGFDNCQGKPTNDRYVQQLFTGSEAPMRSVRIPEEAVPSAGSDSEMILVDPESDRVIELWKATRHEDGSWTACWGVAQEGVSTTQGTFEHPFGVTAAGLSMLGGTILAEELAAGEIDHVVGLALPFSAPAPTVSAPANRTDGVNPRGVDVPAQGQLMRLPADLDIDALNLPSAVETIARAAQTHGIIVWDTAGAVSFRAENVASIGVNPYPALFDGTMSSVLMQKFPLDRLELLPRDYEAPAPGDSTTRPTEGEDLEEPEPEGQVSPDLPQLRYRDSWDASRERVVGFPAVRPGDEVVTGDWDGDGVDGPGLRRGNRVMLWNGDGSGEPDVTYAYGRAGDEMLVGDWDGDGVDTVGIRRGTVFHLRDAAGGGRADVVFAYGRAGDEVLVGDWNGNAADSLAVRRGTEIHVTNSLRGGAADARFRYGRAGDELVVGDWDGDRADSFVVRRGEQWHVRNTLTSGIAERVAHVGAPEDRALAGHWGGPAGDTPAVLRAPR